MTICDRCFDTSKPSHLTRNEVLKITSQADGPLRPMIAFNMQLCEACITLWLRQLGQFKVAFIAKRSEGLI